MMHGPSQPTVLTCPAFNGSNVSTADQVPLALASAGEGPYVLDFSEIALSEARSSHRARLGYGQLRVALSVGLMPMVRADKGSSGVILHARSGVRIPGRGDGL